MKWIMKNMNIRKNMLIKKNIIKKSTTKKPILKKSKEYYKKYRNEIAEKRAIRRRTPKERAKQRIRQAEWRKKHGKAYEIVNKWKKKNPKKAAVHALVVWAVKTGVLVRNEYCEECNLRCKTQGHHEDYSKPLQVIWLCNLCHGNKHRTYR